MSNKNRRILIIIPNLQGGGAERILINILNQIELEKFEIDLYLGEKKGKLIKELPKKVKIKEIFNNKLLNKLVTKSYILFGLEFGMKYYGKKIKGEYDYGLCFLDSIYSDFLIYNNANISKKGIVIHTSYLSNTYRNTYINSDHFKRLKKRYKVMDNLVFVSNESKNEFIQLFGKYHSMENIYNPLNKKEIIKKSIIKKRVFKNNKYINILAIGSLFKIKGFDLLIESCKLLKNRGVNFNLTVLGEGGIKEKLDKLIVKNNLQNIVFMEGFKDNPYVWIKQCDIFVMSSLAEGLPTVLCEAIILEKPVIVPNVSGCREVIDNGKYGVMVDRNAECLAEGLEKLIKSESLRNKYSNLAKERSLFFDDDIPIEKYTNLLLS